MAIIGRLAGDAADFFNRLAALFRQRLRLGRLEQANRIGLDGQLAIQGNPMQRNSSLRNLALPPAIDVGRIMFSIELHVARDGRFILLEIRCDQNVESATAIHPLLEVARDIGRQFAAPAEGSSQRERPFGIGFD